MPVIWRKPSAAVSRRCLKPRSARPGRWGITWWQTYSRIIIPQVLKIVYHPMTNQMVWSVLMSSLGMLVGFRELSGETQFAASQTFRVFEFFAITAVLYYVIVKLILGGSFLVHWKFLRKGEG